MAKPVTDRARRVMGLYRQAAGTDNPHERDAFLAKARQLDGDDLLDGEEALGEEALGEEALGWKLWQQELRQWQQKRQQRQQERDDKAPARRQRAEDRAKKREVTVTGIGRFANKSVTVDKDLVRGHCPVCVERLPFPKRGPSPTYCSAACRQMAYRVRTARQ